MSCVSIALVDNELTNSEGMTMTLFAHTRLDSEIRKWKDGEADYCRSLVMVAPTREVPRGSVASYLEVQISSARRDGRADVANYLGSLLAYWNRHNF